MRRSISLAVIAALFTTIAVPITTHAEPGNLVAACAFDTNSGKPNPLGLRAYISAIEVNGNTVYTYEQFPSNVAGDKGVASTIAQQRKLTFYDTSIAKARRLMLANPAYYEALVGFKDDDGYAAVDAVLSCQDVNGKPLQKVSSIEQLPDGDYRFWSGQNRQDTFSDEELLKQGGILFVFRKKGNQVIGTTAQIDSEGGACVEGSIGGNTVSGFATVFRPLEEVNKGENFEPLAIIPDGSLRVRRGKVSKNSTKFFSALLNLNGYSKINLGDNKPPTKCGS
jgi:hypothetical protein